MSAEFATSIRSVSIPGPEAGSDAARTSGILTRTNWSPLLSEVRVDRPGADGSDTKAGVQVVVQVPADAPGQARRSRRGGEMTARRDAQQVVQRQQRPPTAGRCGSPLPIPGSSRSNADSRAADSTPV